MANALKTLFTDIADAIREKTGNTDKMSPNDYPAEIRAISGGASDLVKYVTFMDETGTETLFVMPVLKGDTCKDPVTTKDISAPTKESDVANHYTYYDWSLYKNSYQNNYNALSNVQEDRTVYARFTSSPVYYTISFYDGTELVNTEAVPYGGSSTYKYNKEGYAFGGWNPEPTNITGDMSCYAILNAVVEHKWERLSDVAYSAYGGGAVVYNGEMYLFGGNTYNSTYVKQTRKWSGTSWSLVSSMALPYGLNYGGQPIVWNDEIHIFGLKDGTSSGSKSVKHYKWNGSSWSFVETVPFEFASRTRVIKFDNEVHCIGASSKLHYKWDGTTWTNFSESLPCTTYGHSAVNYGGELHLFNPYGDSTAHYKWNGSSWDKVGTVALNGMSTGDYYTVTMEIEGKVHAFPQESLKHYVLEGDSWVLQSDTPPVCGYCVPAYTLYNGRIHFMGSGNASNKYHWVW